MRAGSKPGGSAMKLWTRRPLPFVNQNSWSGAQSRAAAASALKAVRGDLRARGGVDADDLGRAHRAAPVATTIVERRARRDLERAEGPARRPGRASPSPPAAGTEKSLHVPRVLGGEVERLPVGREGEVGHRAVEGGR